MTERENESVAEGEEQIRELEEELESLEEDVSRRGFFSKLGDIFRTFFAPKEKKEQERREPQ